MKNLLPRKYLLTLLCLPLLFSSCKKELNEIEIDPVIAWEVHSEFLHNQRYISNLYSADNKLQILGLHIFSTILQQGEQELVRHYVHRFKNVSHHKHPMNSKIFGGTEGDLLFFKSVEWPVASQAEVMLDATKLDPHFGGFSLIMSYSNESFAISENNVALVPYRYHDKEQGTFGLRYFLIKLKFENYNAEAQKIVVEETRILTPNEDGGSMHYNTAHGNGFYVSNDMGFFHISEEGVITQLMSDQGGHTVFKHKGDLYAITWKGSQTVSLYKSTAGNNWVLHTPLWQMADRLTYHAISDDKLIASYNSQLFEVEIGIDKFILRELDNTGLEGNFITSIAKVHDKVYIGTLSGLFSKSEEHLLTYKEEEKK